MSSAVLDPSSSSPPVSRSLPAALPSQAMAVRATITELASGRATSLRATQAGVLRVARGRLWITRDATCRRATEDLVLAPGDSLALAAGERIVLEPWDAQGAAYEWAVAGAAPLSR